jgi:hypothetical protein
MGKATKENIKNLYLALYRPLEDMFNNNLDDTYYAVKLLKIAVKLAKNKELDSKEEAFLEKMGVNKQNLRIAQMNIPSKLEKDAWFGAAWQWFKSLTPLGYLLSGAVGVLASVLFLYPLLAAGATGFLGGLGLGYLKPETRPESEGIKEFVKNRLRSNQVRNINEVLRRSKEVSKKLEELEEELGYE